MAWLRGSINCLYEDIPDPNSITELSGLPIQMQGSESCAISPDGRFTLAYEGEIYNWRSLQGILEDIGHDMNEASLTQVLLNCFLEWNLDFLSHIRGMFSVALWDSTEEKLVLAQDRMSGKRLFYGMKKNYADARLSQFLFSSELSDLFQARFIKQSLDYQSLHHYLSLGGIPDPHTICEGVSSLPSGHLLIYQRGSFQVNQYWQCPAYNDGAMSESESDRKVIDLLEDALKIRKPSLGDRVFVLRDEYDAFLANLADRISGERLRTASLQYTDQTKRSELSQTSPLRKDHFELEISDEQIDDHLLRFSKLSVQPAATAFETYLNLLPARTMGKAAVLGLGGSILFFDSHHLDRIGRIDADEHRRGLILLLKKKNEARKIFRQFSNYQGDPLSDYDQYLTAISEEMKSGLYSSQTISFLAAPQKTSQYLSMFANYPAENNPLAKLRRFTMEGHDIHTLIPAVEALARNSYMTIQVPYYDHRVVEYLFTIKHEDTIGVHGNEPLFKRLASTYTQPAEQHQKHAKDRLFLEAWMKNYFARRGDELFFGESSYIAELCNRDFLEKKSRQYLNEDTGREIIWNLVVLELWLRSHNFQFH